MIPDLPNLSNPTVPDTLLRPYNRTKVPLTDYARGGVALLDSSKGLNVKDWACEMQENGECYISTTGVAPFKVETFEGEPKFISMAFDQNMHYNLAYTLKNGASFLYWYDAEQNKYVTTSLGTVKTPTIRLDDVRRYANGRNDIILSYIQGSNLCVRVSRERYKTEYTLAQNAGGEIVKCGMNKSLRFQWVCA